MELQFSISTISTDGEDQYSSKSVASATIAVPDSITPDVVQRIGTTLVEGFGLIVKDAIRKASPEAATHDALIARVVEFLEKTRNDTRSAVVDAGDSKANAERVARALRGLPGVQVEVVNMDDDLERERMIEHLQKENSEAIDRKLQESIDKANAPKPSDEWTDEDSARAERAREESGAI